MLKFNSGKVLRNREFFKEFTRFSFNLNSFSFDKLTNDEKKLLKLIPKFIAAGHPYFNIYKNPNFDSSKNPYFGMRKDGVTAYAAHPLNVVNILMQFNFQMPEDLFIGAGHDFTEEQDSLRKKLISLGENHTYLTDYETPLAYTDSYLVDTFLKKRIKREGLEPIIHENFYEDIKQGIAYLTPSGDWREDFKNFTPDRFVYFSKVADSLSVNKDAENMIVKHIGDKEKQLQKLDERLEKVQALLDHSKDVINLYGERSPQRSIVVALGFCQDYVKNFRDRVEKADENLNKDDLKNLRLRALNEHPIYRSISYGFN